MDSSQNEVPILILVPLDMRGRNNIFCNQKGPISLRTVHIGVM